MYVHACMVHVARVNTNAEAQGFSLPEALCNKITALTGLECKLNLRGPDEGGQPTTTEKVVHITASSTIKVLSDVPLWTSLIREGAIECV